MRRILSILSIIMFSAWGTGIYAQVSNTSASSAEKESTMNALYIKPIQKPQKIIKSVIEHLQHDLQQSLEVKRYHVDAQFAQDTLTPFSFGCDISAEAGIGLGKPEIENFRYQGPYKLVKQDSTLLRSNLLQFATLSPLHAHKAYWAEYKAISPFVNIKETLRNYDITADSISDETGRSTLRINFIMNKRGRKDSSQKGHGEINGTAFFDPNTIRLMQFEGDAYLTSLIYETHLHYLINYDKNIKTPVVKQINIEGTKKEMIIKATVRSVDE